jgi:hypothetical protein
VAEVHLCNRRHRPSVPSELNSACHSTSCYLSFHFLFLHQHLFILLITASFSQVSSSLLYIYVLSFSLLLLIVFFFPRSLLYSLSIHIILFLILRLHSAVMLTKSFFQPNEHYLVTDNKKSNRFSAQILIIRKKDKCFFVDLL